MTNSEIWLSIAGALLVYLCMSVGLRWWKALRQRRALVREWSQRPPGASAILPEIERLRRSGLAGAPVPARHTTTHYWLIASTRRILAQFAFFHRPPAENPGSGDIELKS